MTSNTSLPHQVYPAILSDSMDVVAEQLEIAQELPIETVHLDVIDGYFTDNLTITPDDLTETDFGDKLVDFHFMVNEPVDFILESVVFKENLPIRAMIAQVERMGSQDEYLAEVKRHGWKAGLALDLYTPLDAIDEASWSELDVILLMGVKAGFQQQTFVPAVLEKVSEARALLKERNLDIEIILDGGVTLDTAKEMIVSGATSLTMGSSLWKAEDQSAVVEEVQELFK